MSKTMDEALKALEARLRIWALSPGEGDYHVGREAGLQAAANEVERIRRAALRSLDAARETVAWGVELEMEDGWFLVGRPHRTRAQAEYYIGYHELTNARIRALGYLDGEPHS